MPVIDFKWSLESVTALSRYPDQNASSFQPTTLWCKFTPMKPVFEVLEAKTEMDLERQLLNVKNTYVLRNRHQ